MLIKANMLEKATKKVKKLSKTKKGLVLVHRIWLKLGILHLQSSLLASGDRNLSLVSEPAPREEIIGVNNRRTVRGTADRPEGDSDRRTGEAGLTKSWSGHHILWSPLQTLLSPEMRWTNSLGIHTDTERQADEALVKYEPTEAEKFTAQQRSRRTSRAQETPATEYQNGRKRWSISFWSSENRGGELPSTGENRSGSVARQRQNRVTAETLSYLEPSDRADPNRNYHGSCYKDSNGNRSPRRNPQIAFTI